MSVTVTLLADYGPRKAGQTISLSRRVAESLLEQGKATKSTFDPEGDMKPAASKKASKPKKQKHTRADHDW